MGMGSAALDGAASWWRTGLRSFVIVGLSAVVPLVLLSLLFGYRASTQQRQAAEFQTSMRIDGAAHRIDSILAGQSAAALGVAGFRSVALADYPRLYEHLQLMTGRHPEWANIILADESGERILDLRSPYGRLLPPLDLSGLPANSTTGSVLIGGISPPGAFAKGRSIPLFVPTLGKDGRRLVVVIALDPILFETVLEEAGLPADWRGAVLDADGVVVARSDNSPL
ncbi:MAG TPA: cache domain-containing protein, partial [Magnetospirillaceae bacterium]|nr:cache domain-containing protein [Magnetospirillaceae bacterium]